jgi:enoyl-[acyl-carrier protein] reductase II
VPTLKAALKAVEAGVDGLVVEGFEGGGFKNPKGVSTMVLLPLVCSKVNVPVIAAGGFIDGRTMLAAFSMGAEGIQMGTRMVSSKESPVHKNWKEAIIQADDQDTVILNRFSSPALRALRTDKTERLEKDDTINAMTEFKDIQDLYFKGKMESSIALTGQVAGRIEKEESVQTIINKTMKEFYDCLEKLKKLS